MFKRKAEQPVALYTDTLRPAFRAAALGIASGDFDRLQSRVFDLTDRDGALEWMEARQIPGQASWTVERHTVIGTGGEDDIHKKQAVLADISFFDALAHVAQYERNRIVVGTLPSARAPALPHYRDVAAALGLPVDIEGRVHPAAAGHALTDGTFTSRELAIAEKSAPVVPVKPSGLAEYWPKIGSGPGSQALAAPTVPSGAPPSLPIGEWDRYRQEKKRGHELRAHLNEASAAAANIIRCINHEMGRDFGLRLENKIEDVLGKTLALIPIVLPLTVSHYVKGDVSEVFNGNDFLGRYMRRLNKETAALPDGDAKSCLEDFARAAMPAYHLEKAIAILNLCRDGKIGLRHIRQGLKAIDRADALMDWDEGFGARMKAEYQAGRAPGAGTFLSGLKELLARYGDARERTIKSIDRMSEAMAAQTFIQQGPGV